MTGTDLLHVPYKSGGAMLPDIIGGTIEIDSAPDRGTRVRITAPLQPVAEVPANS